MCEKLIYKLKNFLLKIFRTYHLLYLGTLISFLFAQHLNAQNIFVTSFETNMLGNIDNQGQWDVESGTALVTDSASFVHSGTKGLNFIANNQKRIHFEMNNVFPWCIVAFDSMERSPGERIQMLKELGFDKYAYDWRDKHLDEMENELKLAKENDIEVISVWLWLNAKRDTLGHLNPSNERIFEILKGIDLKTTIWLSFSSNYFEGITQEQSLQKATAMVEFINVKANEIGCKVALYNHSGWFGNPNNQVEIIKALPQYDLSIVYNFHHAHLHLEEFPQIVKTMKSYLSAVNLNGMRKEGPKILTIGEGDYEKGMIKLLIDQGFEGPWGVLGHIEDEDVKKVLERNIAGLNSL
jgi:sugar phosphate isomerase/epimerase